MHYVIASSQDDAQLAQQLWIALREKNLSVGLADATPGTALASKLIILCSATSQCSFSLTALIARFLENRTLEDVLVVGVGTDKPQLPQILRTVRTPQGFLEPTIPPLCIGALDHSQQRLERITDLIARDGDQSTKTPSWTNIWHWGPMQHALGFSAVISVCSFVVIGGLLVQLHQARDETAAAQAFTSTVLTDLTEHLPDTASHDALLRLADDLMARYVLNDTGILSDAELGRRAQLLHFIGEARDVHGNLAGAQLAFHQAFAYSSSLLDRAPQDPQRLYDYAQSAFWLTNSAYRSGDLAGAEHYAEIYDSTAQKLVSLAPHNMSYVAEAGHAATNLGVIALERGDHHRATERFDAAVVAFTSGPVQASQVDALDVANVLAWQADTQLAMGALAAVIATREQEIALYTEYLSSHPLSSSALWSRSSARLKLARAHAALGQTAQAAELLELAITSAANLFESNSENDRFSRHYVSTLYERARLAVWQEDLTRAQLLLGEARRVAAATTLSGEADERYIERAVIHQLYAEIALLSGVYTTATSEALQAVVISEQGIAAGFASAYPLHITAQYTHGEALVAEGRLHEAQRSYQAVITALETLSPQDRDLRLSDLLARTLWRQGETEQASALRARLELSGYARADFLAFWATAEPITAAAAVTNPEE